MTERGYRWVTWVVMLLVAVGIVLVIAGVRW